MRSVIGLLIMILASSVFSFGQMTPVGEKVDRRKVEQQPVKVNPLSLPEGYAAGQVTGNLSDGVRILNLRWAERSSVACFPGTRFEMFNGNHVLYRMTMPAQAVMTITVVPKEGKRINLYALRQGMNPRSQQVPPDVTSAISCEAKYPIYADVSRNRRVKNVDDGTRTIEYISINSPYSILIGVAGANGLNEGAFDLKVEFKSRN
ncbi:MAG: hypothetical protein ACR2MD_07535 [Aridibacter sp.]